MYHHSGIIISETNNTPLFKEGTDMAKAKKMETYRDKYFTTIIYENRGMRYEVTYSNGWQVCCTPAWVQHKDAQEEIDKMLDNPAKEISGSSCKNPSMDEIYEMLGW